MYVYRWETPGESKHAVELRVHSNRGWFGRKELLSNGKQLYRRSSFEGIEGRFDDPDDGHRLEMRIVPIGNAGVWRPALFRDSEELPELSGSDPPRLVPAPKSIQVSAGLAYLAMLMAAVSFLPITKILTAVNLNAGMRRIVMTVLPADAAPDALRVEEAAFAPLPEGTPFSATLAATGGTPPYTWSAGSRGWSLGIELDSATGGLSGTPATWTDFSGTVTVTDSDGKQAVGAFAVVIVPRTAPPDNVPAISTTRLPVAVVGEPYEFRLSATGGTPAAGSDRIDYTWKTLGKKRLPDGLRLSDGVIRGTPEKAAAVPLTIHAADASYSPSQDTNPWMIPALVSALCLGGFLTMHRRSVSIYGVLIVLQLIVMLTGLLPISATAVGVQALLWVIGAAHFGKMH